MKKFRTTLMLFGVPLLLLGTQSSARGASTSATPLGPICLSTEPFADILVWFIDLRGSSPGAYYFDGVGRDLSGNRAQTLTVTIDPAVTTLTVGFTTYPASAGFVPVHAGGTISLSTYAGSGQCFAPDFASCGDFQFQIIACPAGASPTPAGPVQGAAN